MPAEIHEVTSSTGLHYLLVDFHGRIELADARAIEAWVLPGKPHHLGYLLVRANTGTEYSAEARKAFSTMKDKCTAAAMVVTSSIVRAAVNVIMRYAGPPHVLQMFRSEDEALAWLESRRS
jgi:hypothetical protein